METHATTFDQLTESEKDALFEVQALLFTLKKSIPRARGMSTGKTSKIRVQVKIIEAKIAAFLESVSK